MTNYDIQSYKLMYYTILSYTTLCKAPASTGTGRDAIRAGGPPRGTEVYAECTSPHPRKGLTKRLARSFALHGQTRTAP